MCIKLSKEVIYIHFEKKTNKTPKREIERVKSKKGCINKKSKMLMSFDEYYEKNVSKEDKHSIQFEVKLIEKLIEIRNNKKYTQRKLAEICNIKQPQIAKIESFKCSPQVDTLIKLLRPLGYTLKIEAI
jgi:DNA-binding XRE family transcriptional regulator